MRSTTTSNAVREVLAGTAALAFTCAQHNHVQRYAWIGAVLKRFGYRRLPRADRGAVLAYLQRLSGYSRAQVKRLVKR
ncbi:MAG: hypothetical protein WAW54_13550, partial [Parvibaculum sedimenti]|uniref:hypothetical protein n=1 Tax=Parvibaculum sedimenti TaxID=2608632 RepID=UPI003BB7DE9E